MVGQASAQWVVGIAEKGDGPVAFHALVGEGLFAMVDELERFERQRWRCGLRSRDDEGRHGAEIPEPCSRSNQKHRQQECETGLGEFRHEGSQFDKCRYY